MLTIRLRPGVVAVYSNMTIHAAVMMYNRNPHRRRNDYKSYTGSKRREEAMQEQLELEVPSRTRNSINLTKC